MIAVASPGVRERRLQHLVLDYNGTLAADGGLLAGIATALNALADSLQIHVVTADTFGLAAKELTGLPVELILLAETDQAEAKLEFVTRLDESTVVAVGNGRNDRMMLKAAALGIAVIQQEGAAVETLASADIAALGVLDALDLLRYPNRLVATLRA